MKKGRYFFNSYFYVTGMAIFSLFALSNAQTDVKLRPDPELAACCSKAGGCQKTENRDILSSVMASGERKAGLIRKEARGCEKPVFDSVIVDRNIIFAQVVNERDSSENLCLDVYRPSGDEKKNRPVILWVHGGGFREGSKTQGYVAALAHAFAQRGYVSVSTDYRLRKNPGENMTATINDAVDDVMKALEWIRKNSSEYGIDKHRIIVGGGSAGGILSTHLCYRDASDSLCWNKSGLIAFINLWGGPAGGQTDRIIDKNDPPTLFIHGTADTIVPYVNSLRMSWKLNKAGVKNKVCAIEGAGHTPIGHMKDIIENIGAFLADIHSDQ